MDLDAKVKHWEDLPEEERLRHYVDWLAPQAGELEDWVRAIYPTLWREYQGYMDSGPGGPATERQQFAFELLQHLHQ